MLLRLFEPVEHEMWDSKVGHCSWCYSLRWLFAYNLKTCIVGTSHIF